MNDDSIFGYMGIGSLNPSSLDVNNSIAGVDGKDMPVIRKLVKVWKDRWIGNVIRSGFYFATYRLRDFGISIPNRIKTQVRACIGWPAKAVRSIADLSTFGGFDMADDGYDVANLQHELGLDIIVPETIVSAYTHGCAFLTLTQDPDGDGLLVTPRSAEYSAALWDGRRNRLSSVLTINDATDRGMITAWNVFLPYHAYEVTLGDRGVWDARRIETHWPEPTAVPFISDPQLTRPLGRSRITRPLMALTDMGFRTMVRMEATAEFYSVPKLWFLGASRDAFDKDTWSNLVSAINGIGGDDELGERPEMKQVAQASMQPHSDMLRTIAMNVASETNLPVDSLGITLDNPQSAEAMAAAERKLTREADRQNRLFGWQLEKLMRMAICLENGLAETPQELLSMRAAWLPTREVSDGARGDFYQKVSQVNEHYANSTVGLRRLGLNSDEIASLQTQATADNARSLLDQLMERDSNAYGDDRGREPAVRSAETLNAAGQA